MEPCLLQLDSIEFAWKELGPGSWLVDSELEMIYELLQMCPGLERIVVPQLSEQDVITHLVPLVATTMPQLRHLDLTHVSDQPLGTCCLVESCKDLVSLNMERLQFDSRVLVDAVMAGHGHSLESLDIRKSTKLSSQQLNLLLSCCHRLKSLYALTSDYCPEWNTAASPMLNTNDLAMVPEELGWTCKDLETLQLYYSGMEASFGIPE
ncbi:hypothetical protein BGZ70_003451, partial [Mortierella alpina]